MSDGEDNGHQGAGPHAQRGPSVAVNKPSFDWGKKDKYTEWKGFRRECEMLFRGTYRTSPENERAGAVVNWMGRQGQEIVASWTEDEMTARFADVNLLYNAFEARFKPEHNEMLSEFQFRHIMRDARQSSDEYMATLKNKARECNFALAEDRNIKSQFIIGINDRDMQNKLLEEIKLSSTVEECLQITRNIEATRLQKDTVNANSKQFEEVNKHLPRKNRDLSRHRGRDYQKSRPGSRNRSLSNTKTCDYCNRKHPPRKCPAYNQNCNKCGRKNHFARSKKCSRNKQVADVTSHENLSDDEWTPRRRSEISCVDKKTLKFDSITDVTVLRKNDFAPPGTRKRLIGCISTATKHSRKSLNYKIDTGADSNLLSITAFKKLFPKKNKEDMKKTIDNNIVLEACNGSEIEQLGTCYLSLRFKGKTKQCHFYVVPGVTSLLGLPDSEKLRIITAHCQPMPMDEKEEAIQMAKQPRSNIDSMNVNMPQNTTKKDDEKFFVDNEDKGRDMAESDRFGHYILKKFKNEFEGIGCLEETVQIHLKNNAIPYQSPPRRVAYALQEPLKEELQRLVKEGILVKLDADEKSEWCNSFVCRPKPKGGVRLCLDPAKLNACSVRPVHRGKTLEDVKPKLEGATYFSILDLRSGYWNLKLDHDSSLLTTFSTMFGRFRYTRLPFGLNCAGDIFQQKMDEILDGISNVVNIADDVIVFGYDEDGSDHDQAVEALMKRAKEKNIKFGQAKCKFRVTAVPFFGELISRYGVKPDPRKVEAISAMNAPADKGQLLSFLGHLNFLSKFSPAMAELIKPLRELTSTKNEFTWNESYQDIFIKAKRLISKDAKLQFYRPCEDLFVESDASKRGLGAALLQVDTEAAREHESMGDIPDTEVLRPIAYASKALTETEQNYSNIEREALGILHALEKFHHYTYGRYTRIITDHKPLLAIFKKDVATASPRLQRIMMRIHQYHVSLHYRPGPEMHIADCISRVGHKVSETPIPGLKITVDDVATSNVSILALDEIRDATMEDKTLTGVSEFVMSGWPESTAGIEDDNVRLFHTFREEIGLVDGILMKGTRIIVPESLRKQILDALHYHHLGIEKTRNLARTCVYWPGLNGDIENMVSECRECQEMRNTKKPEYLIPHEIPSYAWKTVGADVFYYQRHPHLCVIDYYSKFPIVRELVGETSADLINTFKDIFAEHGGIVDRIVSDSGSNFTSKEFKDFAQRLKIELITTSPYHHSSNGQVENTIKTVKHMYKKCEKDGKDIRLAMLMLRATPVTGCSQSPAEMLNRRKFKMLIPQPPINLIGQDVEWHKKINMELRERQDRMKEGHDRHFHCNAEGKQFQIGMFVMVQAEDKGRWKQGIIVGKNSAHHQGRSYQVKLSNNRIITRNSKHIRHSKIPTWTYQRTRNDTYTMPIVRVSPEKPARLIDAPQQPMLAAETAEPAQCPADRPAEPPITQDAGENPSTNGTVPTRSTSMDQNETTKTRSGRVVRPVKRMDL